MNKNRTGGSNRESASTRPKRLVRGSVYDLTLTPELLGPLAASNSRHFYFVTRLELSADLPDRITKRHQVCSALLVSISLKFCHLNSYRQVWRSRQSHTHTDHSAISGVMSSISIPEPSCWARVRRSITFTIQCRVSSLTTSRPILDLAMYEALQVIGC